MDAVGDQAEIDAPFIRVTVPPVSGRTEWLQRQKDQEAAARRAFVRYVNAQPGKRAKCLRCKSEITAQSQGTLVKDAGVRCLPCQRRMR